MNQAWHHCRAEKYYLYTADKRSKVKLRKPPNTNQRWRKQQEPVFMCAIFVHMPNGIGSACETVDF